MKRARALLATLLVLMGVVAAPGAGAQPNGVTLRLVAQTPWNSPRHPRLTLKVLAQAPSEESHLSLVVTIYSQLPTRSDYHLSLSQDVGTPIHTESRPLANTLSPGIAQTFAFHTDVSLLERQSTEARVYPVKIELLAGQQHIAELRTPLIFLPKKPKLPLGLAWTFIFGHPIAFAPDGVFLSRDLERGLAPGGSLSGQISALREMVTGADASPVDVVVSPTLLRDLAQMRSGYRVASAQGSQTVPAGQGGAAAAADALSSLHAIAIAQKVELSAMPYGVPDIPQLDRSGLQQDIPPQIDRGRVSVASALDADPVPDVLRPPGSSLDANTLARLHAEGVRTLLLDAGVAEQQRQPNDFAPPALAVLDAGKDTTVNAIAPDEGLQGFIDSTLPHDDPRLASQVILGDLASIWLEQPDQSRTVAMLLSSEQELPAGFFTSLVREISTAPWVRTIKAGQVAAHAGRAAGLNAYRASRVGPIPGRYTSLIAQDRASISDWLSVLRAKGVRATQRAILNGDLLLAEGSYLVTKEALGLRWLASIKARIDAEFAKVSADSQQVVTLTANGGRIPVRVTNRSNYDLQVVVQLVSSRLSFTSGDSRDVSLGPGQTKILTFDAQAETTGTFPVQVSIQAPTGAPLSQTSVVVRSTAYNRVATIITIGAMVVLLFVWARRQRSQRKSSTPES